jgi:hypothetical protein
MTTPTIPEPTATPPPEPSTSLLAGKYATPEALMQGYTELHGKLELPGEPPKFADAKAAEAGYRRLESMLGRLTAKPAEPAKPTASTPPTIPDPAAPKPPAAATPAEIVKAAGLDGAALLTEFVENGKLSPEKYEAIQKVNPGITPEMVNYHLHVEAQTTQTALASVVAAAGGQQQYDVVMQWASGALTPAQRSELNAKLGNVQTYRQGFQELLGMYAQATGTAGGKPLLTGAGFVPSAPVSASEIANLARRAGNDPTALAALRQAASRFDPIKAANEATFS